MKKIKINGKTHRVRLNKSYLEFLYELCNMKGMSYKETMKKIIEESLKKHPRWHKSKSIEFEIINFVHKECPFRKYYGSEA